VGESTCAKCDAALPEGAGFCPKCGSPVERAGEPDREERRVVTALFADLVGSTKLGERLDPEDFRAVVTGAIERMATAIEELGGTIESTAGDGVLGLFGARRAREDDPERAVLAGLRIAERIDAFGSDTAAELGIEPLQARSGIESGLAVLGTRLAGSRAEHVASGDCLNTAARLQGAAAPGGVMVGPFTYRLVEPMFEWDEARALELKGKAEPVLGRQARAAIPAARRRSSAAAETRFVGREPELAAAGEAIAEVLGGEGRILTVSGEAGIGKTRLMDEIRRLFEDASAAAGSWLEGHCASYAESEPYLPFRQILRNALELGDSDPSGRLREKSVQLFGADHAARYTPVLASIAAVPLEPDEADQLHSLSQEALQHLIVEAVSALLGRLRAERPLAVVVDDLHWADPSSLRLASALGELTESTPFLLVVGVRPEPEHPGWQLREQMSERHRPRTRELVLERLAPEAERGLLVDLIGVQTLPEELEEKLLSRAEGNPFYLEELVRSLVDTGALVRTGDGLRFDRDAAFELPDTVERVVLARIDRLPSESRELLTAAAVVGRSFELPLLRWIVREQGTSPAALSELERLGLVERGAAGIEYRFRHPLIQETAYSTLLRERRAELHARAAGAIEELTDELTDEHYPVLARHHAGAGNHEAAARYHGLAGTAARRVFAIDEALRHFDAAIDAIGRLGDSGNGQAGELLLERGRARIRLGDYTGSVDDLGRAVEEAQRLGDPKLEMHALSDLGVATRGSGYEAAISYQERALGRAEEQGEDTVQVSALSRLSLLESNRLRLDRAMELAARALRIARRIEGEESLTTALDAVKLAALQLGDLERLEQAAEEMISIQRRTGDLFFLQWALIEAASVPLARGEPERALELITEAATVNRRIGDRLTAAMILEARSWIDRSRGELESALAAIGEAAEMIVGLDQPEWIAWMGATHGSHLLELPDPRAALPVLERALAAAEQVGTANRLLRTTSQLARARSLLGDEPGAREALARAEELLAGVSAPAGGAFLNGWDAYLAIARAWLSLGEAEAAERAVAPLLAAAESAGWTGVAREARELLGAEGAAGDRSPALADGSQEVRARNLELVREAFASERPEKWFGLIAEDFEFDARAQQLPDFPPTLRGRDRAVEMWRGFWGSWEDYSIDAEELVEVGDQILVVQREHMRGAESGVEIDRTTSALLSFRGHEVVRLQLFESREQALAAARV
jgi:predicted ATPase/class 3 adenylate cyclase